MTNLPKDMFESVEVYEDEHLAEPNEFPEENGIVISDSARLLEHIDTLENNSHALSKLKYDRESKIKEIRKLQDDIDSLDNYEEFLIEQQRQHNQTVAAITRRLVGKFVKKEGRFPEWEPK